MKSERENGEKKTEQITRRMPWFILLYILLTAGCIVFSTLYLFYTTVTILQEYSLLFSIIIAIVFLGFCALSVWFYVSERAILAKTAISVYVFLLFSLMMLYVLQITGFFVIVKDEVAFRNYLEKAGAWMPIVYILFQYLQVILLPVPSIVSTLAGVAIFGAWRTLIYSFIGIWIGSITAYFIGKKLGYKAVAWMVGEESLQKWQKKLKGKDTLVLTLMFFLPIFPDDLFCFVSGLSSMKTGYFVIMITLSRLISIAATCFSLQLIPLNTWWGLLIWGVLIAVFVVAFVLIYKHLDAIQKWLNKRWKRKKNKDTKEK